MGNLRNRMFPIADLAYWMAHPLRIYRVVPRNESRWARGWKCCCPVHDHEHASFYIAERRGRLVVECYAGCTQKEIYEALAIRFLRLELKYEDSDQGRLDLTRPKPILPVPKGVPEPDFRG